MKLRACGMCGAVVGEELKATERARCVRKNERMMSGERGRSEVGGGWWRRK
jgi:hypothetical protein